MGDENRRARGFFLKSLLMMLLLLVMSYLGLHAYFLWQTEGDLSEFNQSVIGLELAGYKVFPAIQKCGLSKVDDRKKILTKGDFYVSPLKMRLESAIQRNEPVIFSEASVNRWLRERLQVVQEGELSHYTSIQGVWVDFKEDEIELIIERRFKSGQSHVVSLFMKFQNHKRGFTIKRNQSQIGLVRLPGGFARLIMPAFGKMAEEIAADLKLYKDESLGVHKAIKIHQVHVRDGEIELDPRLISSQ